MKDYITLVGTVGTVPKHYYTANEVEATSFRLVTNNRKLNDATGQWEDGDPCWYTVKAYRTTGRNAHASIELGQRLVVYGVLRVSQWKREDGTPGTSVQVYADAIGHNLAFGTTRFIRNPRLERADAAPLQGTHDADDAAGTDTARTDAARNPAQDVPVGVHYVDASTGEVLRTAVEGAPDAHTRGPERFMDAGHAAEAGAAGDDDGEQDGEEAEEDTEQAS